MAWLLSYHHKSPHQSPRTRSNNRRWYHRRCNGLCPQCLPRITEHHARVQNCCAISLQPAQLASAATSPTTHTTTRDYSSFKPMLEVAPMCRSSSHHTATTLNYRPASHRIKCLRDGLRRNKSIPNNSLFWLCNHKLITTIAYRINLRRQNRNGLAMPHPPLTNTAHLVWLDKPGCLYLHQSQRVPNSSLPPKTMHYWLNSRRQRISPGSKFRTSFQDEVRVHFRSDIVRSSKRRRLHGRTTWYVKTLPLPQPRLKPLTRPDNLTSRCFLVCSLTVTRQTAD